MAGLIATIPALQRALADARRHDLAKIDEGLRGFGVMGVHGEPEVGTTNVVYTAVRRSGQDFIRVDLDGATSEADVAWMLARGLARLSLEPQNLSLLATPLAPVSAQRAYIEFAERVGESVAALGVAEQPTSEADVSEVLTAIGATYAQAAAPPILWIDHLQAPALVSRHPVDVDELLWNVRGLRQQMELPIILSGSRAASQIAYGPEGAFYGDGVWVTLFRPEVAVWEEVAAALPNAAPSSWIGEMGDIAHRHPATMLLALALRAELPQYARTPLDLWQLMLSLDDGLVGRAVQHARSLHRLGGMILDRIVHGIRPYEGARAKAEQNDRNRALRRLYEAGLITQPRPRTWEVTNPLLAGRLLRQMPFRVEDAGPRETPDGPGPLTV